MWTEVCRYPLPSTVESSPGFTEEQRLFILPENCRHGAQSKNLDFEVIYTWVQVLTLRH
jgi:hypothetical protein